MALQRALYIGQSVSITTANGVFVFPVSSAVCDVTKPNEAVSAFGHLGSLAFAQTNLTTCKCTIKTYLGTGAVGTGVPGSGVTASAIQAITGDAVSNNQTVITVSPFGFTMSGIVTSIGIDMSLGGFGMCDFAFNGVGQPSFADPGNAFSDQASMISTLEPVTTTLVGGSVTGGGCANSFRFTLDMPTDNLACLGDPPDAYQGSTMNSIVSTKPPYKATITVEGYGVDVGDASATLGTAVSGIYKLGHLGIQLPHPKVTAKSFNNAVGAAGATYNYTAEDTSAQFSAQ